MGQMPYQYPMNSMGIPDLNYQWWQHTSQYYPQPPPYQFQPGIYPQSTYFPAPGVSPAPLRRDGTPNNPELRRVQSERRASMPYPEPPVQPRRPLEAQMESVDGSEYDSPPRRSAFDRLRPSARERLGVREEGRRFVGRPVPSYRGDSESSNPTARMARVFFDRANLLRTFERLWSTMTDQADDVLGTPTLRTVVEGNDHATPAFYHE
nr:uncharacterized protein LOC109155647 [Ipomoea batatas]